ncbi:MAG: hypothetical protein ABSD92_08160 [Candidatus Bathyarchaeia archaeon]|jgi:hypothetical protein
MNKKLQISKNRTLAITITIILAFSMTASMMLVPIAHASDNIPVYAYINVAPNPTGVNQRVEIIMWVNVLFGGNAEIPNNYRFTGWVLTITAPDGTNTTTTLGTVTSSTSDYDYFFTPITTGSYIITFNFPATAITASNDPTSALLGDTYLPTSASTSLTVQQTPIASIPQTPFPTAYWTRPIYGENTAWYALGSNWLGFGSPGYIALGGGPNLGGNGEEFGPTTNVGPLTSHVMWTMPLTSGGVVGQTATTIPANTYAEGSAYDQKFQNPIIVDGMLIFKEPISQTEPSSGPTVCINLQTGQQIWSSSTMPAISFAYVYDAEDPNQHGVWPPMIVASVGGVGWEFFDAFTGTALFNMTNPPSGTAMMGPNGEYLSISLHNYGNATVPNWYMYEWNSSMLWDNLYSGPSTTPTLPPPITNGAWTGGYVGTTYEPSLYDFNVSLPWLNTATLNGALIGSITVSAGIQGDILLARAGNLPSAGEDLFFGAASATPYTWYGIGLNQTSGNLGAELWSNTLQPPAGNITVLWAGIDPVNNVFVENYRETMQFVGFSLATGNQIWGPTPEQASLDYYGSDGSGSISDAIAYGNIYSSAYAGILYCYSTLTGDLLWTYGNGPVGSDNSTNAGVETPFGNYPTFVNAIGSGVIYTVTTEHTEETPIFKGAVSRAINATTGLQIWALSDYVGEFLTSSYAIADGFSIMYNGYDNQVYSVGQGPSQTTVNAGPQVTTVGDNVVISGTVMDISAGTKQTEQAGDFPNGVPVSSDASMTAWMGYVYQQQPMPTNFKGVPVTLSVLDSNGNYRTIGTTTTDPSGRYTLTWTPNITGNYTVYANFAGTNGYWPSSDETSFNVMSAPATSAPTATPLTGLASSASLEYGIVAVIVVIVIIGAVLALIMLRKKP